MLIFSKRWLLMVFVVVLAVGSLVGCGGGDQDASENNGGTPDAAEGDYFDFNSLYMSNKSFKDGESFKMNLWQKVDGEESSGWISVAVAEVNDEFTFEYAWEFDGLEYSGTINLPEGEDPMYSTEDGRIFILFNDALLRDSSYIISKPWECAYIPVLENFEGLDFEKVGDKESVLGYQMEVTGRKTYAGQEGINFTMHQDDQLLYELCISPDIPVNLYAYIYDYDGNEFRAELVEYSN